MKDRDLVEVEAATTIREDPGVASNQVLIFELVNKLASDKKCDRGTLALHCQLNYPAVLHPWYLGRPEDPKCLWRSSIERYCAPGSYNESIIVGPGHRGPE